MADDTSDISITRMTDIRHVWRKGVERRLGIQYWYCSERHGDPNGDKCDQSRDVRPHGDDPIAEDRVSIHVDAEAFVASIKAAAIRECAELARARSNGCGCGFQTFADELEALAAVKP